MIDLILPSFRRPTRLIALTGLAMLTFIGREGTAAPTQTVLTDNRIEKIVAVVNDEAISAGDLNGALKLALVAGNFQDTPELRSKLTPEVLRNLVDDQIKLQEAKRLKLKVDQEEIDA